ncbi:MAG: nucleoside-diphosphate sugar epimerase [Acidobacteria bacterium]|nr:MAG: nucleoside-diphosphate sugar epimerase [Acidobacteriota bacterium]
MSPETVLVTGGAGFIGSALCHALVAGGRRVIVFDDLSFGRADLLPAVNGRCVLLPGDLRAADRVADVVREFRPRRVYHLGAIHFIPYCNAHPEDTLEINVNGTRNVLAACREFPPDVLVLASTAAVYPVAEGPITEDEPPAPIDVYGRTKLLAEDLCRAFQGETGVPTVLARFFNAFGPHETNPHLVPDILLQLRTGSDVLRLGNLEPVRDYVHVTDLVAALIGLGDGFRGGLDAFNVGSGRGRSVREVVEAFAAAMGRTLRIVQDPDRLRRTDRPALVSDIAKIARTTGWRPKVAFETGIAQLLADLGRAGG